MLSLEEYISYIINFPLELILRIFYYYGGFSSQTAVIIKKEIKKNLLRHYTNKHFLTEVCFDEVIYESPYTYIVRSERYNNSDPEVNVLKIKRKAFIYHVYIRPPTKIYGSELYILE